MADIIQSFPAGAGSGHTILDTDGIAVAQEKNLQFNGLSVTDNSAQGVTEVAPAGLNQDSLNDIAAAELPSSNAVGSGFNYSTTEQIIGRWIDGKPIYQKSVTASSLIVGNNEISHNISNLKRVIKCDGTVMRNGDNFTFSLPICYIPNLGQWSIAISGINKLTVNITVGNGFTGTYVLSDLVLTLQYTKTTD